MVWAVWVVAVRGWNSPFPASPLFLIVPPEHPLPICSCQGFSETGGVLSCSGSLPTLRPTVQTPKKRRNLASAEQPCPSPQNLFILQIQNNRRALAALGGFSLGTPLALKALGLSLLPSAVPRCHREGIAEGNRCRRESNVEVPGQRWFGGRGTRSRSAAAWLRVRDNLPLRSDFILFS